jgi:hypothetical protein
MAEEKMKQQYILDKPRSAKAELSCVTADYGNSIGLVTSSSRTIRGPAPFF